MFDILLLERSILDALDLYWACKLKYNKINETEIKEHSSALPHLAKGFAKPHLA